MESQSLQNSPQHLVNGDLNENAKPQEEEQVVEENSCTLRKRRLSSPELSSTPPISRRASYVIPKKEQIRSRSRRQSGQRQPRAVSPRDRVREYLSKADEKIEDYLERIVQNVHDSAENAQVIVQTYVHKLQDWTACHFEKLPLWMKDNEFLHFGHRPELPNVTECFKSIFRIHTETGNIWTHLIGFVAFVVATIVFYVKPLCDNCHTDIQVNDKLIFLCFFIGAILCLACSTLFHTLSCHSKNVSAIFSRLDYAGIALLIVGSVIPWLYYGFYCSFYTKMTYIMAVSVFGLLTLILIMWEKFNNPEFRVYRAVVFVTLALVSALPIIHFLIVNGYTESIKKGSLHNTVIMGALYLTGALLYAARIPERWMPGKCDIWFQSHQLFHLLVVAAAFVHYHGISEMAMHRLSLGPYCPTTTIAITAES